MAISSADATEIRSRTLRSSWPICPSSCAISGCSFSIAAVSLVASRKRDNADQSWPTRSVASLMRAKRCVLGCRACEPRAVGGDGACIGFDRQREFDLRQAFLGEPSHRRFDAAELQHRDQGCDRGQRRDHDEGGQ